MDSVHRVSKQRLHSAFGLDIQLAGRRTQQDETRSAGSLVRVATILAQPASPDLQLSPHAGIEGGNAPARPGGIEEAEHHDHTDDDRKPGADDVAGAQIAEPATKPEQRLGMAGLSARFSISIHHPCRFGHPGADALHVGALLC